MFGTRTEADAAAAKQAAPRLRELYRRERPRVGVSLALALAADGAALTVRDAEGRSAAETHPGPLAPGQKPPEEARTAYCRSLEKTGGTPFFAERVGVEGAEWFLPGGAVNELRRRALESLLALREERRPWPVRPLPPEEEHLLDEPPRFVGERKAAPAVRVASLAQLSGLPGDAFERLIAPLSEWRDVPAALRGKTWLELPRALFGGAEEAAARAVAESRDGGFAGYAAENIAHFKTCAGLPVMGGFGLNVTNPLAARAYAAMGARALTLSPELTLSGMERAAPDVPTLALAYGHMPLMLTRACPLRNVRDCAHCDRTGALLDRKGLRFPVRCTGPDGARTVYNPIPLYWGDRRGALPATLPLLYFTLETPRRAAEVLALFCAARPFNSPFTRGLYEKGTS